jgi:hypothetical protein
MIWTVRVIKSRRKSWAFIMVGGGGVNNNFVGTLHGNMIYKIKKGAMILK